MGQLLAVFRGTTANDPTNGNANNATTPAGLRRLFILISTFLPFGQHQMDNSEQETGIPPQDGGGHHEQQGAAGTDRRRRRRPPTHANLSSSGGPETGGRGSPNSAAGSNGTYFGSHFLMGGELYESSKPEVFLFGDQQDLELLGNKSVKFPFSAKGVTDSVGVLNALVNVRKDSVKFTKVGRSGGGYSSGFYRLEFIFDCDVSCFVQIHFCAREHIDEQQPQLIQILSRQPQFGRSERFHFPVGANQQFSHFTFKPHRYDLKMLHWDGGPFFPVVIEIRSVSDQFPEQVQTTLCSIERSNDQSAVLILKPMKQKLFSDGVMFLLQEIFGIENKESAETAPPALSEENGAECIICMANSRDTMILPCRHLCICNGCAETLRYKLNNCPICRSPFKALLKIKAMRNSLIGQAVGSDGSMTATRIRREPMTLIEAINGPFASPTTAPLPPVAVLHQQQQRAFFAASTVDGTAGQSSAGGEENPSMVAPANAANDGDAALFDLDHYRHPHKATSSPAATPARASMVARCQGSNIVTSTIVHPSPPPLPPLTAVVPNYHQQFNVSSLPLTPSANAFLLLQTQQQQCHQTVPLSNASGWPTSRRDVVLIGGGEAAMPGTATVIDWLGRVNPQQKKDQVTLRRGMETIEMGQLRSRRASHSNVAVHQRSSADDNSSICGSRSPSLSRSVGHRHFHSQFFSPNASCRSTRSFGAKSSGSTGQIQLGDDNKTAQRSGQRRGRQHSALLGSTPNLVTFSLHSCSERGGGDAMEAKQRKRSETLAMEMEGGHHLADEMGTAKRRKSKEEKGHQRVKRRPVTPRGTNFDNNDPILL